MTCLRGKDSWGKKWRMIGGYVVSRKTWKETKWIRQSWPSSHMKDTYTTKTGILNLGHMDVIQKITTFEEEKNTSLLSLSSNWILAFSSIVNMGQKNHSCVIITHDCQQKSWILHIILLLVQVSQETVSKLWNTYC